ncbi:MAG: DUF3592 domain-containing protein [Armatimonadetes bacterium]|nr:DUF3592 domain-containing protein [Armatimonadota bacterium]
MEAVIAHEIEPEIAGPPPRAVRLPWRTQALLALAGALAALLFVFGARAILEAARLGWVAASGRAVAARVVAVRMEPGMVPGDPARPSGLQYEYVDPFDGSLVRRFARISPEPPRDPGAPPRIGTKARPAPPPVVRIGDRLPLRVARWRGRSVALFWRPSPLGKGFFLTLCGLVVMGVSVRLMQMLSHWRRLRTRLLSDGVAAVGTIIHKYAEVGDTPHYFLRYGYATVPAGESPGEALEYEEQISREQWQRFEIGQPVTVLYDPAQPAQAGLYALMKNG